MNQFMFYCIYNIEYFLLRNEEYVRLSKCFQVPDWIASFYYKHSKNSSTGRLYTAYRTTSGNLRKLGYFTATKRNKNIAPEKDPETEVAADSKDFDNESKLWLSIHSSPWEAVEVQWKNSFEQRQQELKSNKDKNIGSILLNWPLYQHSSGYRLIDLDFGVLYPQKNLLLFQKWNVFQNFCKIYFEKKFRGKKNLLNSLHNLPASEELEQICIVKLLHYILKPTHKGVLVNTAKHYKSTIKDSIRALLVEVESVGEIQVQADTYKQFCIDRKLTVQPYLVVVKGDENSYYLSFDGIFYKFSKFLDSLDTLFKLIFVFEFEYPTICKKFWTFLQIYFYEIKLPTDDVNHQVLELIEELIKYQNE